MTCMYKKHKDMIFSFNTSHADILWAELLKTNTKILTDCGRKERCEL